MFNQEFLSLHHAYLITLKFLISFTNFNAQLYYYGIWYRHSLYSRLQRVTLPDAVIIQFVLLKMGILMLETCRGL